MKFEDHLDSLVPILARLTQDPAATVFYDQMSAALVWSDEALSEGLSAEQMGCLRALFRFRTSLIDGEPDRRFENLWNTLKAKCPLWIGFDPHRCMLSEAMQTELNRKRKTETKRVGP